MLSTHPRVRTAELVATLSFGADLGLGQPMEHVIQQTMIALRMSELIGVAESERVIIYYSVLLAWVGCHTDAYEQAKWFGDDIQFKSDLRAVDAPGPRFLLAHLGAGKPFLERARLAGVMVSSMFHGDLIDLQSHWMATDILAQRLDLGEGVRQSLKESYERWDGKGPGGVTGEDIGLSARLANLADVVAFFNRSGGVDAAIDVANRRSGKQFDPDLVDLFVANAPGLLESIDGSSYWTAVLGGEPGKPRFVPDGEFDRALEAIGDFTDLKSPYTIGHSRAVADLASRAARKYGMTDDQALSVRRAGLVHDIGRLGVSNGIWDKPGKLTETEFERVRLHPYITERMLSFSQSLAPLGAIAVQHHERLDGSGYPRGLAGAAINPGARLLGAADVYHAMVELRPHRPARSPRDAAEQLRAEVSAGRLERDAVQAVLDAAGHRTQPRDDWPERLTAREVDVLRLLARGLSNKDIAQQLGITRKTVGNHVEHIFSKTGVHNRARASVFAVRNGLMNDVEPLDVAQHV